VKSTRLMIVFSACLAAGALWPADAAAQHRGGGAVPRSRTAVVVSAGYYRPYYYNPFFYSGFYGGFYSGFYSGFYAPFYAGWYPYYGQSPYPGYYSRSWASARLEMKPRDAQVFLDGYFVGNVDQFDGVFQRLDLPTGEHEIEVYMKGYRTYRQRTLFRPGETYHFKGILEPVPAGAPEEPAPQPSANAPDPYAPPARDPRDPYMRDPYARNPGQDPNGPPPPQPGEPGEPGRPMPMPNRPGDPRNPGSNSFGTLNIRVQPGDATVVIDGERWDSPDGGSRLSVQLAAGSHRVDVRKDGFKPYTATIQIRPGDTQALNISLPPGQN
jgi:PEGA domain